MVEGLGRGRVREGDKVPRSILEGGEILGVEKDNREGRE